MKAAGHCLEKVEVAIDAFQPPQKLKSVVLHATHATTIVSIHHPGDPEDHPRPRRSN
jgi:hypothetical protein